MVVLSLIKESILFALHSLFANKLRTFLSLLGITIGIFAIIVVFTIVDSLESNIRGSIESLGENVVFVQKWPWTFGPDYPWWKYMNRPVPKYDELFDIQKKTKTAEAIAYRVGGRRTIKYGGNIVENAIISGCSYEFYKIKSFEIEEGRYFTENEANAGYNAAVIGNKIAEGLFPGIPNPVGREIKIAGKKAYVIGIFKKEGESMLGNSMDNQVVIPFHFAKLILDVKSENSDPYIAVKAKPGVTNAEMIDELTGIMRSIRRLKPLSDDDFALNETNLLSKGFDGIFEVIGIAGWIIGGFSILVGGFGIANIMFVSVKERTSIIGIQKSLGAKNYFILLQFLCESVFLSLIGGILGLLLTYLITLAAKGNIEMEITLSNSNIILGLTISVLIGIVSGFVPAYSASQLDPVEAIRSN